MSSNLQAQPSGPPPAYDSTDESAAEDEEYQRSRRAPGVDLQRVRSAVDEERPLPDGWIRQFDQASGHHFYVQTDVSPPRSIWVHPFDDPEFIRSIPDTERDEHTSADLPSSAQAAAAQRDTHEPRDPRAYAPGGRPQQQQQQVHKDQKLSLGDKVKEKLTGRTKEERAKRRRDKAAAERAEQKRLEELYLARRQALRQMQMSDPRVRMYGQPGIYAAPSMAYSRPMGYGGGLGYGGLGYGGGYGGYGRRPMGYGGVGMPLMGGLGGGLLLGSMMGGGFGGGSGGDCGGGDFGGGGDGGGGGGD